MAEAGTSDCETQKNKISSLINKLLKKGDIWYLVESKWYKQWKKYVGYDSWDTSFVGEASAHPGPVDNSALIKENSKELKENLIDELDYQLVPEEAWQLLVSWYGVVEGQDPLPKKVIEQGMFVKHCKVEVYLMDLKLSQHSGLENPVTKQFSRADTIEHIEQEMKKLFDIKEEKEVRLWNKYMSNTYEQLNKMDNTVQDAGLYQGQVIVIEEQCDDGTWPRQVKASTTSNNINTSNRSSSSNGVTKDSHDEKVTRSSSSTANPYSSTRSYNYSSSYDGSGYHSKSGKPGLCGLSNLGNTCFMNSAIQCMSNVPALAKYFMSGKWVKELNEDNPLGMRGEIATSYAELVKTMWSGKYSYTVPRNFKVAVGRFAPQFSGYQQQDSQELMAFLLDGLHEDLNRIKKKPYVEVKDADGRPDDVVSSEAWDNYLKRNDSVITDTFHGLLKSTLVCPECDKISVTFDPFCYLSLPLPMKKERQIEVFFVPLKSEKKTKHFKLTVPKLGHVQDLCMALSKKVKVPYKKLVVTDVYNHKFHKVFTSEENLSHIMDRDDIFVYEVPVESADDPETLILPVYNREDKVSNAGSSYAHVTHHLFGTPLLVPIPRKKCTYETLYNCILDRMMRYVNMPKNLENWLPVSAASNSSGGSDSDNEPMENGDSGDDETEGKQNKKIPEPFTFSMVNSYGSTDVECIRNDGKPIKFTGRSYVAMDWHHHAKTKFYDEKKAEALEVDDSVNTTLPKKTAIQLSDCIDLFTNQEKLGEQDPWYCPKCKKHQQAFKKFDLWQLPQVLVIHLKRFSYNRFWRDKIDTLVEYPVKGLNMQSWVLNEKHIGTTAYDLIAVSNHYGGMGGGHYTAYAKNHEENRWYYFDDSSVSEASSDSPVTKAGYVLVYERRSPPVSPMECNGTNEEDEDNRMDIESNHN